MKQFKSYETARVIGDSERLPEGGYVCQTKGIKYVEGTNGNSDRLVIAFDITEGDYKDFFKNKFEADASEDKKWKGTVNVFVPKDDGTEQDGWTANAFRTMTNAFEESNDGYVWNWDEKTLDKKIVGIAFGTTNSVIEGKEVSYTEARTFYPVEKIRSGNFKIPKVKNKNGATGNGSKQITGNEGFMNVPAGIEEVPF